MGAEKILGMVGQGVGAASSVAGALLGNTRRKQQMGDQKELMEVQQKNQMALNEQGQKLAQENWDYTNAENQRRHYENAGLNVGLMYGGSGAGGTLSSGSGGGAAGGSAPTQNNELGLMGLQMQQMANQNELTKAQVEKLNEETEGVKIDNKEKLGETTKGGLLIENLKQSGIAQWLQNIFTKYEQEGGNTEGIDVYRNAIYNESGSINEDAIKVKKLNAEIFKTEAEKLNLDANALITNKKAEGYWQELLNATSQTNSQAIQAAAQKLSAEWNTGEFTNWKTWAELAMNGLKSLGSLSGYAKTPINKIEPKK